MRAHDEDFWPDDDVSDEGYLSPVAADRPLPAPPRLALSYSARSDIGLLRETNSDSAYAGPHLLAVADGLADGAGAVASASAIDTLAALDVGQPPEDLLPALANAVASANMGLQEAIMSDPATEGMRTTLTALLWADGHAGLCHIGHSRAYLLREGNLYQITHDHTVAQRLIDEGRITEEEAAAHPQREELLRSLDGRALASPDLTTHESIAGDRYLICSDGLSGVVTEQTLHQVLIAVPDPDKAIQQLVLLALKDGGPDNITCIVADVVDTTRPNHRIPQHPVLAGAAPAVPMWLAAAALTPASVRSKLFSTARLRSAYDQKEVDDLLEKAARELARLTKEGNDLRDALASIVRGAAPGDIRVPVQGRRHVTAQDVRNSVFTSPRLRPGYDQEEVDQYLDRVEAEIAAFEEQNMQLRTKLAKATASVAQPPPAPPASSMPTFTPALPAPAPTPTPAPTTPALAAPTVTGTPLEPDDPRQVGVYKLSGRLGVGGMGTVFIGTSPGRRKVAVKILHPQFAADPEFRARFRHEVEAARRVNGFYTASAKRDREEFSGLVRNSRNSVENPTKPEKYS